MNFSEGEKLIMMMLSEIYEHLNIKGDIDPKFVQEAIWSGNTWGLERKYPGIFNVKETSEEIVRETGAILAMWDIIEYSYKHFSPEEQERVKAAAHPFDVTFRGFDGNYEGSHISAARFLIEHLESFQGFKGRSLNSHAPSLDSHRTMLAVFNPLFPSSLNGNRFSPSQVIEILKAQ